MNNKYEPEKRRVFVMREVRVPLSEVKQGERFRIEPIDKDDAKDVPSHWMTAERDGYVNEDGVGAIDVADEELGHLDKIRGMAKCIG